MSSIKLPVRFVYIFCTESIFFLYTQDCYSLNIDWMEFYWYSVHCLCSNITASYINIILERFIIKQNMYWISYYSQGTEMHSDDLFLLQS
jgi:hypothetical protein